MSSQQGLVERLPSSGRHISDIEGLPPSLASGKADGEKSTLAQGGKGLVAISAMKVGDIQCLVITTHHAPLVPAVSPL